MNKKAISPILLTVLALLSAAPIMPAHAQLPALATDMPIYSGDPGSFFDVFILVSDVTNMIAYDVTVSYDTNTLSAVAVDFDSPATVFGSLPHFNVINQLSDPTGTVRSAITLTGGNTVTVSGPPALLMQITFTVDQSADSPIDINNEQLVALVSGSPAFVCNSNCATDAVFQAPPTVQLHRWDASVSPSDRQKFLSKGETSLTLVGTVRMTNKATRGGYAFIVFDIVGPNGDLTQAVSNTVFVNPGEIVDVTSPYTFAATTGRYEIFATLWRGPTADFFVQGESTTGLHFFVHF